MIPKLTTGNGFGGSLRYDTRQGQGMKPGLAKVLDVSGVEFDIDKDGNYVINTRQVSRDFRAQTMGYQGKRDIRKPVYHWALSYHPNDKVSEEQMIEDAKDFLKRIGFDDTQYVMTVHYDKDHHHLHIVTNVVNNQGQRISTMGLIDKAHEAAAAITRERGYIWGEKTRKQDVTQEKIHDPHDRARKTIEPIIREAKEKATSLDEFKKILESQGVSCQIKVSQDGKRGGISFGYEYEGQMHTFRGSSVSRQLSFGYIIQAIQKNRKQEFLKGYNEKYRPLYIRIKESCDNSFQLYKIAKENYGVCSSAITGKYSDLREVYGQMTRQQENVQNASSARGIVAAVSVLAVVVNPVAALVIGLVGGIIAEAERRAAIAARKELRAKARAIKDSIEELKTEQAALRQDKSDLLKVYVENKKAKETLRTEIDNLKLLLNKPVEQEVTKQSFDIFSIMKNSADRRSFDTTLLGNFAVMEPVLDKYNGVIDFHIMLAREKRKVLASQLLSEEKLHEMFGIWKKWTNQKPAYELAWEREFAKNIIIDPTVENSHQHTVLEVEQYPKQKSKDNGLKL